VTIAQAILESATPKLGWGSGVLFRLANNPFGIKHEHYPSGDRVVGKSGDRMIGKSADPVIGPFDHSVTLLASVRAVRPLGDRLTHAGMAQPDCDLMSLHSPEGDAESPAHPITRSLDLPIPYVAFDAHTGEMENGQKQLILGQFLCFRNLAEAFRAHAQLLCGPRYRPAFEVRNDYEKFAERLGPKTSPLDSEHCGYSTNPSYSAELLALVKRYRLHDPRALGWYATGVDPGPT
jgi:hypothetical protein